MQLATANSGGAMLMLKVGRSHAFSSGKRACCALSLISRQRHTVLPLATPWSLMLPKSGCALTAEASCTEETQQPKQRGLAVEGCEASHDWTKSPSVRSRSEALECSPATNNT